jgi:hypothetical protein
MSGKRYWRSVTCSGCFKGCRYSRFRVINGVRGGDVFKLARGLLRDDSDDPADWTYKTKGKLLGTLFAMKQEAWRRHTDACSSVREAVMARAPTVLFVARSSNRKTGYMPTSWTSIETCPPSCPWLGSGCYAEYGYMGKHWLAASVRGLSWDAFCGEVAKLPRGTVWRHNVAGDLPGKGDLLDAEALGYLVEANRERRGFTYTHKPMGSVEAMEAVRQACAGGFTVNLSANTLTHADALAAYGVAPVAVVLPRVGNRYPASTPGGRRVVVCPALSGKVCCGECCLCTDPAREAIVGFPAHGARRWFVTQRLQQRLPFDREA